MIAFFRLIRITNLLIITLSLSLFYFLILVPVHHNILQSGLLPFTTADFVLFVLSVVCIAAAGNIINDYFDFELDKAFKPMRPLPSGAFSLDFAMYAQAAFAFAGLGLGFYLGWVAGNYKIGYVYVGCLLLLYVYSAALKKVPLAGNLVVAGLSAFVFLLLMIFEATFLNLLHFEYGPYAFDVLKWQVYFYSGFAFLTSLVRELVKDLEDMEGDKQYRVSTFPVQFGAMAGKVLTTLFWLGLVGATGFFTKLFWEGGKINSALYLIVLIILPCLVGIGLLWRSTTPKQYGRISLLLKFIMLLGVLSIPAFYLFNR